MTELSWCHAMTHEETLHHYDQTKHVRYEVLSYYPDEPQYRCTECWEITMAAYLATAEIDVGCT